MSPAGFDILAIVVSLAIAAIPAAFLLLRDPAGDGARKVGVRALLGAAAGVTFLTIVATILLDLAGLVSYFGAARVVYMGAVVSIPLIALVLFVAKFRGRIAMDRFATVLAALGLLAAPVGAYATFVEPGLLVVERPVFVADAARAGTTPVRIAVLADLQTDHVGSHEARAIDMLMAEKPDLILMPGDLFQGNDAQLDACLPGLRTILGRLDAPLGVYFVMGDVDSPRSARLLCEGTKIRVLKDEIVRVRAGDRSLTIGGASTRIAGLGDRSGAARVLRELEETPGTDDIRIAVTHAPDATLCLPDPARTDLVVAGHTHGGQIQIPGFGAPVTLSRVPREVGSGGLHRIGARTVYVSRGVGMERRQAPRIRLFCRPEITLLTIAGRDDAAR